MSPVTFHMKEKTVLKKKVLPKPMTIGKIIIFCLSLLLLLLLSLLLLLILLLLLFPLRMKILFDLILEVSSRKIDFVKKRLKNSQH